MQAGSASVHRTRAHRQHGFTYIAVLVAMLMLSLATQGVMTYVSQQAQREREADLLRVGQTYVQAIGAYYEATPGSVKRWPAELEDLLEDRRLVAVVRHMRELYADPIARTPQWDLIRAPDGGIAGVRSTSSLAPIRMGAVELDGITLPPAARYADWDFIYIPPVAVTAVSAVNKP
jgi:type II secretory pathway pseudopilin PulG